jgi:spore coat polysaccharide biosynthesis protein SpsF (cytidylyltransferase family)
MNGTSAKYICRITGDCPLIPHHLISKAITLAVVNEYDYTSNVNEKVRTSMDGHDVEVMSAKALKWADINSQGKEREHVTLALRSSRIPNTFKIGHMIGYTTMPLKKLSVDTEQDLEVVREEVDTLDNILETVNRLPGKNFVHRY